MRNICGIIDWEKRSDRLFGISCYLTSLSFGIVGGRSPNSNGVL
ncbi:MAG: hypothetical protein AB4063_06990 [Crocosphaera sp.]